MGPRRLDLSGLERVLGYQFQDADLLARALTHSSHQAGDISGKRGADNERLEFLGDRVLGLSICFAIMSAFPKAEEGELARRFNRLVRRKMCADVAGKIQLGGYLILSDGEARSGGRTKSTILANAMEAVLGAIFIDGGFEAADEVIKRLWQPYITDDEAVLMDAKTALQEWVQGQGLALPDYIEKARSGPDHAPIFVIEARVADFGVGVGQAGSKRAAEQKAAQNLLEEKGIWQEE